MVNKLTTLSIFNGVIEFKGLDGEFYKYENSSIYRLTKGNNWLHIARKAIKNPTPIKIWNSIVAM